MKVLPSAQCRRAVYLFVAGLTLLLPNSGCATRQQNSTPPAQTVQQSVATPAASPSGPKLLLKGDIDCATGEVKVTGGLVNEGRFRNLGEPFSVLVEKGYDRDVLKEVGEDLILCDLDKREPKVMPEGGGPALAIQRHKQSLFLEAEVKDSSISFSLSELYLEKQMSVVAYVEENKGQKGCERISENCVKCPDKKIYCTVVQK